jgi:hypothetical protein
MTWGTDSPGLEIGLPDLLGHGITRPIEVKEESRLPGKNAAICEKCNLADYP